METTFKTGNNNAFRLRRLKNGKYQIHKLGGKAFEGPRALILRAAFEMRVDISDFRYAVKTMRRLNHDYADFGIFGTFLWTAADSKAA